MGPSNSVVPVALGIAELDGTQNCTELGNARRLVRWGGRDLRYCPDQDHWLKWDGVRWRPDTTGEIEVLAKALPDLILKEAWIETDSEKRRQLLRWSLASESAYRIRNAINLAKTEPGILIESAKLDSDPMLLAVKNGVVDLRTGKLVPSDRNQLITKQAGTTFDPTAACPRWERFLNEITAGNEDLISFMQRLAGYLLTGLTGEQCLFVLLGPGANGKTVFQRLMQMLLGEYGSTAPPETLLDKRDTGGPSPDLVHLRGARLAVVSESRDDSVLREAVVKRLTGQDRIMCRDLYLGLFEYVPTFKFVLATNSKPIIHGTDHAIWRRIRLIPFKVIISSEQQDRQLSSQIAVLTLGSQEK